MQKAVQSLLAEQEVGQVRNLSSLGFYNRFFWVPKPNNRWHLILDLSVLNRFLQVKTFSKVETPESIRLSLQQGEWVTSLGFSDAYLHIPVIQTSRKYLHFHLQGQTLQFWPFGLSTTPMEFTLWYKR